MTLMDLTHHSTGASSASISYADWAAVTEPGRRAGDGMRHKGPSAQKPLISLRPQFNDRQWLTF